MPTIGADSAARPVLDQPRLATERLVLRPLTLKDVVALQAALKQVVAVMPDGTELRQSSLRRFIAMRPAYIRNADDTLTDSADGSILRASSARVVAPRAPGVVNDVISDSQLAYAESRVRGSRPVEAVQAWIASWSPRYRRTSSTSLISFVSSQ